jgi:nucleotide-binding universal stress UspA family protein
MAARPRTILVGYDGSEAAQRALGAAADLAGYGSRLTVATVNVGNGPDDVSQTARELLHRRQVTARYVEPVGEPAEQLIETAAEIGADLVVVGRRSRNVLTRLVLGSVSADVVRGADCDVLVVR